MIVEEILALLRRYEEKKDAGKIGSFTVRISATKLTIIVLPDDGDKANSIVLTPDLQQTLRIFFSDIDGILYNSFDYTTLKSLLNAHGTLERMTQHTDKFKSE